MLVEPQRRGISRMRLDQRGSLARAELFLELAGELGIANLDGQHVAGAVPDIFGRQLDTARQQVPESQNSRTAATTTGTQTIDVRAATAGGNQIHIASAIRCSASLDQTSAQSTASCSVVCVP